jgi:hypothetical protein
MNASIHVVRNLAVAVVVLVAMAVVAAAIDGALATMVILVELGLILVVLPFLVIHYDEHDERLRYRRPGRS